MVPTPAAPSDAAPHLLVVDDDRRIRDLLLRFLSADGYRVTTAETAAEARAEAENRIKGLELGADDYLAKPFEPRELLLRIANILKRQAPASPPIESVRFGEFVFHITRGELRRGDEIVH